LERTKKCAINHMAILEEIKRFKRVPDLGEVGNGILYEMCRKYPYHKSAPEIIAKVWLIGRSYAVSIERSKRRKERKDAGQVSDDFYSDTVAPSFLKRDFDEILNNARNISVLIEDNLILILKIHKEAVDFIAKEITGDNKRSFVSKYLHFHFPALFFIYDSRVSGVMDDTFKEIGGTTKDVKRMRKSLGDYDRAYADFFIKCFCFFRFCKENDVPLNLRQVDSFLIRRANEKIRSRGESGTVTINFKNFCVQQIRHS